MTQTMSALKLEHDFAFSVVPPNYSLVYAKLSRHVAIINVLLEKQCYFQASCEIKEAMETIKAFENLMYTLSPND
jgi:hypothetical protein